MHTFKQNVFERKNVLRKRIDQNWIQDYRRTYRWHNTDYGCTNTFVP